MPFLPGVYRIIVISVNKVYLVNMKGIKIRGRRLVLIAFLLAVGFLFFLILRRREVLNMDIAIWVNLLVAIGTISMVMVIVCIEIIKPWLKKPKVMMEFDNKAPFCRAVMVERTGQLAYCIRVRVRNTGKTVARRLRGKLVEVANKNGTLNKDFDPLFLHWTTIETVERLSYKRFANYLDPIDLKSGEFDYLDVFSAGAGEKGLVRIATSPYPRGCRKEFRMSEGIETFKITIYGDNIDPVSKTYKLVTGGKEYNELEMIDTSTKSKHCLPGKHA